MTRRRPVTAAVIRRASAESYGVQFCQMQKRTYDFAKFSGIAKLNLQSIPLNLRFGRKLWLPLEWEDLPWATSKVRRSNGSRWTPSQDGGRAMSASGQQRTFRTLGAMSGYSPESRRRSGHGSRSGHGRCRLSANSEHSTNVIDPRIRSCSQRRVGMLLEIGLVGFHDFQERSNDPVVHLSLCAIGRHRSAIRSPRRRA